MCTLFIYSLLSVFCLWVSALTGFFLYICNLLICHLPTQIFMGQTTHTGLNKTKQQIIVPIVSNAGNNSVLILRYNRDVTSHVIR